MIYKWLWCSLVSVFLVNNLSNSLLTDFATCHDDSGLHLKDGMVPENTFSWLGFVEYMHTATGLPHHSKTPRVVLIHRIFVLATAQDVLRLPKNYKLGNIIFGEYDREEEECNLTRTKIKMGLRCPRAVLEIPFVDIIPHPEFSRFGVGNSLALMKLIRPIQSNYVLPVCLPSVFERERIRKAKMVVLVDYVSSVPRDFHVEKIAQKSLKVYTHRECRRHRMRSRLGSEGVTHVLCTSGCGVRAGAPIISHARDGPFELIGLAAASDTCERRKQRNRLNPRPPIYIDVYPYSQWIINIVIANLLPNPYPDNFQLTDSGGIRLTAGKKNKFLDRRQFDGEVEEENEEDDQPMKLEKEGWRGRSFIAGKGCFNRPSKMKRMDWFFYENFLVTADPPGMINVHMKIIAEVECKIKCVKVYMPNRLYPPSIKGVNRHNISIEFNTGWFPYDFFFSVSLYAINASEYEMYKWSYENNPYYD